MKKFGALLFAAVLAGSAFGAVNKIYDASVEPVVGYDTLRITAGNTNILMEPVYAESSCVVLIEEGSVIRGLQSFGSNMAALVICQGAKIIAVGSQEKPIVFTSLLDDLADPCDFGPGARGLWGGLVVCGYGKVDETVERYVEGLPASARTYYGGSNNADNSGQLSYLSIRFGGSATSTDNEVNGLSLYAVGSGTEMDHIEVLCNADDGIEWFGGAASIKYAAVAYVGDDGFDYDHGWTGKGQFWFNIHNNLEDFFGTPDRGAEMDGKQADSDTLFSNPTIANATIIGPGADAEDNGKMNYALVFRDAAAGKWYNSVITEWPNGAVFMEDDAGFSVNSREHMINGDLKIEGCYFGNFGAGNTWADISSGSYVENHLAQGNYLADPALRGYNCGCCDEWLDPRPSQNSPVLDETKLVTVGDPWFDVVDYAGAFAPDAKEDIYWLRGWTGLWQNRFISNILTISPRNQELITSGQTKFDLLMHVKVPGFAPSNLRGYGVELDGNDVTAGFQSRSQASLLADGGVTFKVPDLRAGEFGAEGCHTLSAWFAMRLPTGRDTIRDTVTWYVQ